LTPEKIRRRSRIRTALLAVIGMLYVASIPWYRESGAESGTLFGFPDWVAVSIGCYIAIAILNSIAWLLTDVPDAHDPVPNGHVSDEPGHGTESPPA
jgi:hypothetical protein